jgi:hypothetical protein
MVSFSLANVQSKLVCARCGAVIDGPLALAVLEAPGDYVDLKCGAEINPESVEYVINHARRAIPDVEAIRARLEHRFAAERDANRKAPKNPVTIEQIRDPKGRPRVRVLAYESGPGAMHSTAPYLRLRALCPIHHVWSSIREYAIVWDRKARDSRLDPAQPIGAAIYCHCASAKVPSFSGKLVEWRALGLATPARREPRGERRANDAPERPSRWGSVIVVDEDL